ARAVRATLLERDALNEVGARKRRRARLPKRLSNVLLNLDERATRRAVELLVGECLDRQRGTSMLNRWRNSPSWRDGITRAVGRHLDASGEARHRSPQPLIGKVRLVNHLGRLHVPLRNETLDSRFLLISHLHEQRDDVSLTIFD